MTLNKFENNNKNSSPSFGLGMGIPMYSEFYNFSPTGYITLDHRGKIIEINLAASKLLLKEKSFAIGKSFGSWIPAYLKRTFMRHLQEVLILPNENMSCDLELRQKGRNSSIHVKLNTLMTINPANKKPIFHIALIDLTAARKVQILEGQNKLLKDEKNIRENFVATLSHDLRTPLTSSKLCAQMLASTSIEEQKKTKLYQLLVQELDRADRMIKELLDANRITSENVLPLSKKKYNLDEIARKSIESFMDLYGDQVKINYCVTGDAIGKWSEDALQRILENLFQNAMKYGAPGGPISLTINGIEDKVIFTVHNMGPPITPQDQKNIFLAFHRTQDACYGKITGWGLGLNLVNNLVKRHQGTIRVKSSISEGTSFIIELPKNTSL